MTSEPFSSTDFALLTHDPASAEIVRRLVTVHKSERTYLFGSAAHGEAGQRATTTCWSSYRPMPHRYHATAGCL